MHEMSHWTASGIQTVQIWEVSLPDLSTPESVLNEVCRLTGTDTDDIRSKSRRLDVVIVRQVYCYAARELTGTSMKEIGKVIHRDHATVIYSCRVIADAVFVGDRHVMDVLEKIKSVWK
jgi:chromosomal replication initiation ATPase DnaA